MATNIFEKIKAKAEEKENNKAGLTPPFKGVVTKEMGVYYDQNKEKWIAQVPTGDRYPNGRAKYQKALADTEKEAIRREREMLVELELIKAKLDILLPQEEVNQDYFEGIANEWIEKAKTEPSEFSNKVLAHSTWRRYDTIVKSHLIPKFGHRQVHTITEEEIRQHINARVSQSDKRQHFFVLRNILKTVGINVMVDLKAPSPGSNKEVGCIKDPEELQQFIEDLKGTSLYYPSMLMAATGLSMSELAGLKWSDVDLKRNFLTINRSLHYKREKGSYGEWYTKDTKRSSRKRTISVDEVTISELQELKDETKAKNNDFVFLENGKPINGVSFSKRFTKKAEELGYNLTPHGLRHSHATILIMIYKVDPKTVSRRLGHSSVEITLRVYSAFIPQNDAECANIMGDIFRKNTN